LAQLNDAALQNAASDNSSTDGQCNNTANASDTTAAHAAIDSFFAQLEDAATTHALLNVA